MLKYKKLNLNPKKYQTSDAVQQVLVYITGVSWEQSVELQKKIMLKYKFGPCSTPLFEHMLKYICKLRKYKPVHWNYHKIALKVKHLDQEFSEQFMKDNIIVCQTKVHCLIIDNGYYIDKFDAAEEVVVECYYKPKN